MKLSLTVGLLAIVGLAACGGSAAPASTSASAQTASRLPASSGAAASSAVSSAEPSPSPRSQTSATANGPVKVGVVLPLTGPQAIVGKDNEDALKLYLSSVHNTVAGRTIEAVFADDGFKADVGLTKAKELVENDHVAALMGFVPTPGAYAVAQYVKTAHVPMLITADAAGEGMLTNPKFASPYLTRWTSTISELSDPAGDWTYKHGYRKAVIVSSDFAPGIQFADFFASTFIRDGGAIVQEQYPALGTTDFGPFLAQLDKSADVMFEFLPGVDGLRFADQYSTYTSHKLPVVDLAGVITSGSNLAQLKDKAAGMVGVDVFNEGSDDPGTQAFVKAWQAAYPGRFLSHYAAAGYTGGQVFAAALKAVGGQVEHAQQFLQALYGLTLDDAKGPMKLDHNHDIVQSIYVYRVIKQGSSVGKQTLSTVMTYLTQQGNGSMLCTWNANQRPF